jgi:hypothetical protein
LLQALQALRRAERGFGGRGKYRAEENVMRARRLRLLRGFQRVTRNTKQKVMRFRGRWCRA